MYFTYFTCHIDICICITYALHILHVICSSYTTHVICTAYTIHVVCTLYPTHIICTSYTTHVMYFIYYMSCVLHILHMSLVLHVLHIVQMTLSFNSECFFFFLRLTYRQRCCNRQVEFISITIRIGLVPVEEIHLVYSWWHAHIGCNS